MADAAAPSQSDPRPGPTPGLRTHRRVGPFRTLGWGAYLACSWTWCIGMFLPILLVRDFGLWGFVVFAIPNCLGAAAMGWVLTHKQSRDIALTHRPMVALFSAITIAFHYFFLVWLWDAKLGGVEYSGFSETTIFQYAGHWVAIITLTLAAAGFLLYRKRGQRDKQLLVCVVVALILTPVLLFVFAGRSDLASVDSRSFDLTDAQRIDLIFLAFPVAFGFLLCPYLDATFLRARRWTNRASGRAAFTLGFLGIFPIAIIFTVVYMPMLGRMWWNDGLLGAPGSPSSELGGALLLYIGIQTLVTVILHFHSLVRALSHPAHALLVCFGGIGVGIIASTPDFVGDKSELGYRLFLSAYGLLFPAYVYLCMIPTADGHAGPTRRKAITWLAACALAAPFFWLGFIEFEEVFLLPGMAIVLASRLLLPGGPIPKLRRAEPNPAN